MYNSNRLRCKRKLKSEGIVMRKMLSKMKYKEATTALKNIKGAVPSDQQLAISFDKTSTFRKLQPI